MRPKKIYLSDFCLDDLARHGGAETWTLAATVSDKEKQREYTDLSQVWHDPKEKKPKDGSGVILHETYPDGGTFVWTTWYTKKLEETFSRSANDLADLFKGRARLHEDIPFWGSVDHWAYLKDVMPFLT